MNTPLYFKALGMVFAARRWLSIATCSDGSAGASPSTTESDIGVNSLVHRAIDNSILINQNPHFDKSKSKCRSLEIDHHTADNSLITDENQAQTAAVAGIYVKGGGIVRVYDVCI